MKSVNFNFGRAAGAMLCAAAFLFFGCDTGLYTSSGGFPELTGTVEITGTGQVGQSLTAVFTPGEEQAAEVNPRVKQYLWQSKTTGEAAEWVDIGGAVEDTYQLTGDDQWKYIQVLVKVPGYRGGIVPELPIGPVTMAPPGTYTVTIGSMEYGTVTANPPSAAKNTTVTLTVNPNEGYTLKPGSLTVTGASGKVDAIGAGNTFLFIMPAEAVTVTAEFDTVPDNNYTINTTPSPPAGGAIATLMNAEAGDPVQFTVTVNPGYQLNGAPTVTYGEGETVTVTGEGPYNFTMPAASVTIGAAFTAIQYSITKDTGTNGTVTVKVGEAEAETATVGQPVTLTVTPEDGYQLSGALTVTDGEGETVQVTGEGPYNFTMPAADVTIGAAFTAIPYNITKDIGANGTVTVKVAGDEAETATVGQVVTLTVTPAGNYKLKPGSLKVSHTGAPETTVTVESGSPPNFKMPAAAVTVTAEFVEVPAGTGDKAISFASEDYTSGLAVDADNWSDEAWTLNVLEAGKVYFAVNKDASNTIEVGGTDAAKVTQAENGETIAEATEAGLTASEDLAVFTVDTRDLVFEGGERNFTLGDVAVTLNVLPNLTGAAVFTVTWPEGQDYYTSAYEDAVLTRVWGAGESEGALQGIEYVDRNATANTEYLVRVEKDELNLPRIFFVGNGEENVTLRLRGMGEPRTLAFNDGYGLSNHDSYNSTFIKVTAPGNSGNRSYGFINIGFMGFSGGTTPMNKKTLVLDNNIIVKGNDNGEPDVYKYLIYVYGNNATLVLRKGAVITEFVSSGGNASPIYVVTKTANSGDGSTPAETNDGKVRIEGGSITNCTWGTSGSYQYLIFYVGKIQRWWGGSFYMAESTEDNPIVFKDNTNNKLYFSGGDKVTYLLEEYTAAGLTAPEVQQ